MSKCSTLLRAIAFALLTVTTARAGAINLSPERTGHTATLLNSGKVLIAGGVNEGGTLASALLYDPGSGSFTPTGSMTAPRAHHTATLLQNGKVLITGSDQASSTLLKSAEIYDPSTGLFTKAASMSISRTRHSATSLQDGRVLLV